MQIFNRFAFDVCERPDVGITEWLDVGIFSPITGALIGAILIAVDNGVREILVNVSFRKFFGSQVPHAFTKRA